VNKEKKMDIITIIILVIIYSVVLFILPFFGARAAFRKGRRTMGITIIATTLLGVGWLLAIFALVQPYKMIENGLSMPCPQCGSKMGSKRLTTLDRQTQKPTTTTFEAIFWGIFAIVLIGGSLMIAISIWKEGNSGYIQWQYGSTLAGIGFFAIGIALGRIGVKAILDYRKTDRAEGTYFMCGQCKHEWAELSN
jgi:hypothetical protein